MRLTGAHGLNRKDEIRYVPSDQIFGCLMTNRM